MRARSQNAGRVPMDSSGVSGEAPSFRARFRSFPPLWSSTDEYASRKTPSAANR